MSPKTIQWLKSELKVIISLSLVLFALDTSGVIIHLYNEPFSLPILSQAILVLGQSVMRALLTLVFPTVFDHQSKGDVPILTSINGDQVSVTTQK